MGAINKFMNMLNIGSDEAREDEEYEEECYETENSYSKSRRNFSQIEEESPYSAKNIGAKVIPMNTAISSNKMVITQPTCYEDVQEIGEYLKNKKSVIVNLENVNKEDARRILDFMGGAAFIVEGTIQKVSNLIYLITPRNVEIQNDVERKEYKQKLSFSWMK
jgi:cell division inhibitor SepF